MTTKRFEEMDALRGFAVFGILLMNIYGFAHVGAVYINPLALGPLTSIEWAVWSLLRVFVDYKFLGLFSVLFGAGVALFCFNARAAGKPWIRLHIVRMLALAVFGLLHAYFIWYGDILVSYAICGLIIFPAALLPVRWLLVLGIVSILVPVWGFVDNQTAIQQATEASLTAMRDSFWQPSAAVIAQEIQAYQGSWAEQFQARKGSVDFMLFYLLPQENIWKSCGFMLLGMSLYKSGFFQNKWEASAYLRLAIVGIGLGLIIGAVGLLLDFRSNFDITIALHQGRTFLYLSSVPQALGYASLLYWVASKGYFKSSFAPMASVGRLAFSNYIMQSLICTAIFYGWGLGLYGEIDRVSVLLIVFAIWGLQFMLSSRWLMAFRYGPLEWLWRSVTYLRFEPLRRGVEA